VPVATVPRTEMMTMKHLIYERSVQENGERIGLRLYRAASGFLLERYLVQGDELTLVQLLPVSSGEHFDRFESADPHHHRMSLLYREARNMVMLDPDKEVVSE